MALPANLTNNEVKDRAAASVSFTRISTGPGREVLFAKASELPARPHRVNVKHAESGTGLTRRRRSVLRVDLTFTGHIDSTKTATASAYIVLDIPLGNMTSTNEAADVLANLNQLLCTQGAAEVALRLNGSGYGAAALLNGDL